MGRFRTLPDQRCIISALLNSLDLDHKWHQDKAVVFSAETSGCISFNIYRLVPSCMHYKLPPGFGGVGITALEAETRQVTGYVELQKVEPSSPRKYRDGRRFDIHVASLQNYSVGNMDNGFVIHNTIPNGIHEW